MADPETPAPKTPASTKPAPAAGRETELPWCHPKPGAEDVRAPDLVAAIMANPTYRQADRDVDFLQSDGMRGVRLQLDYWKAERVLSEAGIDHAIVVFGGTRIPDPSCCHERVVAAARALEQDPGNEVLVKRLSVARRLAEKSHYYNVARDFGRLVGEARHIHGERLVIVTGGGPGMMEAANRGARDAGAKTVGLNISLRHEQFPNPYLTPGLCLQFHYFALRKLHFMKRARALVFFPGGYGTLDEMFEALTLIQTRKIDPVPVILIGQDYWRRVLDIDFLVDEGVIDPEDRDLFWYAESAQEAWDDILRWYEMAERPLPGWVAE